MNPKNVMKVDIKFSLTVIKDIGIKRSIQCGLPPGPSP